MPLLTSMLLSGGSIIDLDGTVFVQAGIFFLALIVLNALIFQPILRVLDAREEAIGGAKEEAARLTAEADGSGSEFADKLRAARAAGNEARDELRKEGTAREAEILAAARAEADKELASAQSTLDADAKKLRGEIDGMVPGLAAEIASTLLQRKV